MRTVVWFAPNVIETMRYYKNGRNEIRSMELLLECKPLLGREFVDGIPSIRALNKSFQDGLPVLTWQYVFAPLADFIPHAEMDEIFVFDVGRATLATRQLVSEFDLENLKAAIIDVYNTVKNTA